MSFSQPLGLHKHLKTPGQSLEVVPLFTVLLLALMMTLLGSRFIFAPGLTVELPRAASSAASQSVVLPAISVLTLLKDNSLIYKGRLLSVENFEREVALNPLPPRQSPAAEQRAAAGAGDTSSAAQTAAAAAAAAEPRILLIKADAGVSLRTLLQVMNAARRAGYEQVQIAEQIQNGGTSSVSAGAL